MLRTLLGSIDITGAVITADALHCPRDTAEAIVGAGGHYIFTVKANQPKLRKQLKELPWKQIPILDTSIEHGHGRTTKRTLKATAIAAGILFPLAAQVLRLTRTVTDHKTNNTHTEIVYAVTSLTITDATAAQVAGWLRGHWAIENKLHWVRDVTYAEDHSQVRTGNGPHVMAALRNAAIGLLRLDGHDNIAKALRHHARNPHRPVKLLLNR